MRLVLIRGLELLSDCGSHADAAGELQRAFEGVPSWVVLSIQSVVAVVVTVAGRMVWKETRMENVVVGGREAPRG
jgi:hypothetical protein